MYFSYTRLFTETYSNLRMYAGTYIQVVAYSLKLYKNHIVFIKALTFYMCLNMDVSMQAYELNSARITCPTSSC